jgi:lysophospholipase L1-like esterase
MYDLLITGGCSFTYGYGLDDRDNEAWTAVLANKIGISFVNLGVPAAGNTYISNSVIDYVLTNKVEKPLIVIGWSHWSRTELCDNRGHLHHITVGARNNPKIADTLFNEYTHPPYLYKKYLNTVLFTQAWARDRRIDCLMFDSLNETHSGEYMAFPINRALSKNVDRNSFLGFKSKNFNDWTDTSNRLPDGHPNAKAHRQMAEILHEALLNMNHKEQ